MKQRILVIGSGGREHALAWKIAQSPLVEQVYCAPGNGGTAVVAQNVALLPADHAGIIKFARRHAIDLTVVAPDNALAAGLVDALQAAGLKAFGPTAAAAQIESSKAFAKDLMMTAGIPTAHYQTFTDLAAARAYLAGRTYPQVVKASGLALGKGVSICADETEAVAAAESMLAAGVYGAAGRTIVIEDYLPGAELSLHAFCDGQTAVMFPPAQDHKSIGDGGAGPNTGGMGAYAPAPFVSSRQLDDYESAVVTPVLQALQRQGSPFHGVLYPGLMIANGRPTVLEYNARFGDPETQSYLRLLASDIVPILHACVDGTLAAADIRWSDQSVVTVVMASDGYPGSFASGYPISGLAAAAQTPGVEIFHAGTRQEGGQFVTAGGRVLAVSATAMSLQAAHDRAYEAVKQIHFYGARYRTDIAARGLAK